jgi:SAM-dependent methyltransferase
VIDDFETMPGVTRPPADIGRLWQPAEYLEQVADRLRRGTALDLACGAGRESVFLAALEHDLVAVDVLPDALYKARALAAHCAPAVRPIHFVQADLEAAGSIPEIARAGYFDAIVGFRYLHRPLFARFREWLTPGGMLVYETFTTLHRERHGKPARDAFVLRPGELSALLSGFEFLDYSEDWRGVAHTARALARWPG